MFLNTLIRATGIAVLASNFAIAQTGKAESYPDRPVKIILPYPAGGSSDATARFIAKKLGERWGQPVLVDNRPGGSGVIGTQAVERSPRDGYTVLYTTTLHIQNEALGMKLPYDPTRDFVPVIQVLRSAATLVVPSNTPANSLQQYVALVKSQPGKHSFGSAGNTTTSHLYGELLNQKAQLGSVHVPYKGGAPMMTDLLGEQISYSVIDAGSVMPMVTAGKVKLLAQTGPERSRMLPNTPTFRELGMPGFESYGWMGFYIATGTAPGIIARWEKDVSEITQSAEFATLVSTLGMEPTTVTGQALLDLQKADMSNWKKIASDANISVK
jgi:tripartite-type tricarboxylate transporter receptor subunit TctC